MLRTRILACLIFLLVGFHAFSQLKKDTARRSNSNLDTGSLFQYNTDSVRIRDTTEYIYAKGFQIDSTEHIKDSIRAQYQSESYYYGDSLNVLKSNPDANDTRHFHLRTPNEDWLTILLISILVFFVLIRLQFSKNLPQILQAYWNDRVISQFMKDDNFFKMRAGVLLFFLFSMILALLIYSVSKYYHWHLRYDSETRYFFILLVILGFYSIKFILIKCLGYIFSVQRMVSGYLSVISVSNFVYSLGILPMLVFYQYIDYSWKPYLLIGMLLLLLFNTFYKYIRVGVFVLSNFVFPKFYLIVYFCTLEIIPLILILKLFN